MSVRVACLTPAGSGAIAVIALRGGDAWSIVQRLFRPASNKSLPASPVACATWFGCLGDGSGDEVILSIPSLQPEPRIEIHCHGGRMVIRWLIDQLLREGCIEVAAESFAEENEAWALLPHARTLRTAGILLDQAQGAFTRVLNQVKRAIAENRSADARTLLTSVRRFERLGRHLIEPWRVAIAGAPNAGKSSLLNALAGYQRSVVAPIPGTTRDVVTATLAFSGWPVELADTAGLRVGGDELEREGMERARRKFADADLCLWVIDTTGSEPGSSDSFAAENGLSAERVLPILNKIDLPSAWERARFPEAVQISVTTGEGIDELIREMLERLIPEPPLPGAAVPYSAEAARRLADAAMWVG